MGSGFMFCQYRLDFLIALTQRLRFEADPGAHVPSNGLADTTAMIEVLFNGCTSLVNTA